MTNQPAVLKEFREKFPKVTSIKNPEMDTWSLNLDTQEIEAWLLAYGEKMKAEGQEEAKQGLRMILLEAVRTLPKEFSAEFQMIVDYATRPARNPLQGS